MSGICQGITWGRNDDVNSMPAAGAGYADFLSERAWLSANQSGGGNHAGIPFSECSGITKPELEAYLREILNSKNKSGLAFCSDEEGLLVDGVIASVLMNDDYRSLYSVIVDRYRLRKSKLQMANELQAKHPDWPLITCRRRIDTWLSLAESILYAPVCDAFGTNSDRFKLQSEQESA